jgi:hypothetical protein
MYSWWSFLKIEEFGERNKPVRGFGAFKLPLLPSKRLQWLTPTALPNSLRHLGTFSTEGEAQAAFTAAQGGAFAAPPPTAAPATAAPAGPSAAAAAHPDGPATTATAAASEGGVPPPGGAPTGAATEVAGAPAEGPRSVRQPHG